jgi:hypothetical protein
MQRNRRRVVGKTVQWLHFVAFRALDRIQRVGRISMQKACISGHIVVFLLVLQRARKTHERCRAVQRFTNWASIQQASLCPSMTIKDLQ